MKEFLSNLILYYSINLYKTKSECCGSNIIPVQLLGGDYTEADLNKDSAENGQTEYEFPLLTSEKQKKSDRVSMLIIYYICIMYIANEIAKEQVHRK